MFKRFLLIVLAGALFSPLQAAETIYGPITRQDTLWKLAESVRPSKDVTTQQVMMALYKKNPHAFTVNNISSLRKDAYMLTPTIAETKSIKRKTAIQMVRRHNTRWKKRRYVRTNAAVPPRLKQKLAERDAAAKNSETQQATTTTEATTTGKATQPEQQPVATANTTQQQPENGKTSATETALHQTPQTTADNASLQNQLTLVQQELAQTKVENKRLNTELVALKEAQKQTALQSKAGEQIQVQLDALRHELDELKTILTEKDNHIKVLQASLKDASQAIKSQHADNMRLYNKLKELSPESLAATAQTNSHQNSSAKPQIKLASVTGENVVMIPARQETDNTGISQVWADELPGNSDGGERQVGRPNQPTNAVTQNGGSVTLSQLLNNQSSAKTLAPTTTQTPQQASESGFTFSISRSAAVSPVAWAAVLISFIFILFLIVRALLMQGEMRRLEQESLAS